MAYISKKDFLQAYKTLAGMRQDPSVQGATQNVSAIRHFVALDRFYKTYSRNCNTRDTEDKKNFADFVGDSCRIHEDLYTTNFYYPLKQHLGDYSVGSNFYSAGQVSKSLVNIDETLEYPKRGTAPLMMVKNGELLRDTALYKNIDSYLESERFKVAFVVWLIRRIPVDNTTEDLYNSIAYAMRNQYTDELVQCIFPNTEIIRKELAEYKFKFNESWCGVSEKDIKGLFAYDSKKFKNNLTAVSESCLSYLSAIRTKPFLLLAGISGTGKSRIVRRLAQATTTEALEKAYNKDFAEGNLEANRWNIHKPANFEIIQVKPNWHNSMDLVGYQTNIPEPHYVFMPFAEFIAKAWLHKDVPFFLCLDEMNLAPVEEYFAEFLSAIESRSKDGKNYETDPIIKPFETFGEKMANEMIDALLPKVEASKVAEYSDIVNRFKTKGLTLPENLIVIGTVNMDETTFSFSRKVLDRAMSFEMNEVDYDSFLQGEADIINKPLNDNEKALLTDRTIKAQEVASEIDADAVIGYLKAVNGVLDNTPFKLGYRAANEAMLYVSASRRFGQTSAATALDEFTLMKILSRIEGDEMKLKTDNGKSILDELEEVIKTRLKAENNAEEVEGEQQEEAQENAETPKQPAELKSLKKLTHMKKQLSNNHFVSYWE